MGINIGGAWNKHKKNENEKVRYYITVTFDKAFLELCPQLKGAKMILNRNEELKSEKSPNWFVSLYVPQVKEEEKTEDKAIEDKFIEESVDDFIDDEDIPF